MHPLPMLSRRTLRGWALACGLGLCVVHSAWGNEVPEYRLKAAFLYKFAAFVEWPPEVGGVLNLCVYGYDPFGTEIDGLQGKRVGSRKVVVQRVGSITALKGCQVVFVSGADIDQLPLLVAALAGLPILTVADSPGAAKVGAMLNLIISQGRVGFEANLGFARASKLGVSSRLLVLAKEVIQ